MNLQVNKVGQVLLIIFLSAIRQIFRIVVRKTQKALHFLLGSFFDVVTLWDVISLQTLDTLDVIIIRVIILLGIADPAHFHLLVVAFSCAACFVAAFIVFEVEDFPDINIFLSFSAEEHPHVFVSGHVTWNNNWH